MQSDKKKKDKLEYKRDKQRDTIKTRKINIKIKTLLTLKLLTLKMIYVKNYLR